MSRRKLNRYKLGEKIKSLDELSELEVIYLDGQDRPIHRNWFMSWQIRVVKKYLDNGWLYRADLLCEYEEIYGSEELTPTDIQCVKYFAANNMSESAAGRPLYLHRNSVRYHLDKVYRLTGLNPRNFHDLVDLLDVLEDGGDAED